MTSRLHVSIPWPQIEESSLAISGEHLLVTGQGSGRGQAGGKQGAGAALVSCPLTGADTIVSWRQHLVSLCIKYDARVHSAVQISAQNFPQRRVTP